MVFAVDSTMLQLSLWPPLSGSFGSALIPVIDSFFDAFSKINSLAYFILKLFNPQSFVVECYTNTFS